MTKHEKNPLFTVIIPVKDRAKYLYHTLRTCMIQNYDNLKVIVSDDGSTDNTREVVEEATRLDSRISYISRGSGVGMRDNFEQTLQQVKPGYVIALGGDDGLLPGGIQEMWEMLSNTGMDMLSWPAPLYSYPNTMGSKGQLAIYYRQKNKIVDSHEFLCRQAKHLNYLGDIESPMFYVKGVVSTKLIDKVRNRSVDRRFYACPTPDGYSGIVLAGEVEQYAFSAKPFSIYGLSPASQGLGYLSNEEKAKKSSEEFFKNASLKPMHRELASQPYSPLITLMTVDYLLTARDLPGWGGNLPSIEYSQVLMNGIKELSHGLYGQERICRELQIMNQIANTHGLGEFFRLQLRASKRYKEKIPFNGNGINSKMIFFDADDFNIENIFDAAYAAKNIHQTYTSMRPSSIYNMIYKSIMYRIRTVGKGKNFPPESEWSSI
jgi:glycosyltransferase involved in cell wall biosynthesis